jgi:hypothetical protein
MADYIFCLFCVGEFNHKKRKDFGYKTGSDPTWRYTDHLDYFGKKIDYETCPGHRLQIREKLQAQSNAK